MSLIEAIKRRDLDAARRALAADPDAAAERDEDGVSALLLALYSRQPLIVDEIARRRAELDVFEASAAGHLARVRDLVARDPGLVNAGGRRLHSPGPGCPLPVRGGGCVPP